MSDTLTFDNSFADTLKRESWSFYGVACAVVILRTFARVRQVGRKGLQPDDYLVWLALGLYTGLVVCLNNIAEGGGSNLYPPGTPAFTPEEVKERIRGSKVVIVSEQCMLNTIYTLKVCLLFFYARLTSGLAHQRAVKILAVAVACGWVASEVAFFTACTPFKGYWAVPPPNPQCTTLQHYAIVQACFNIPTDFAMLCIALPLVYKMAVPLRQKAILMIVFSMGIFVVVAAICTKIFNLTNVYSTVYMLWYIRESSVAMYVANLPMIWPLIREMFPFLKSFGTGKGYKGQYASASNNNKLGVVSQRTGVKSSKKTGTKLGTAIDDKDTIAFSVYDREAMRPDSDSETDAYEMQDHSANLRELAEGEIRKTTTFAVKEDDGQDWEHRQQANHA